MRVKVANRIYRMNKKEYEGLLNIASEQVSFGIYAAEKGNYAELLNIKCKSKTELKKHIRRLKQSGFKVLVNEKENQSREEGV
ncbi:MAG: hypothetical protein ACI4F9_01005 [Lachnospiraceae bacterium]